MNPNSKLEEMEGNDLARQGWAGLGRQRLARDYILAMNNLRNGFYSNSFFPSYLETPYKPLVATNKESNYRIHPGKAF